jgi:hypothetical protein
MYIFCASPGRSGTRFFAEMFKYFTNIPSFHEPLPKCVNKTCREINTREIDKPETNLSSETFRVWANRIFNIDEIKKDGWYFESNHMFIKSMGKGITATYGPKKIGCIYINRPLIDYLMSYSQRGKRQKFPLDFQLHPTWHENHFKIKDFEYEYGFYEQLAWNYFEVKARYLNLKRKHQFAKTYEFDFRKINDITEWQKLFAHFEVPLKRKVDKIPDDMYRHQSGYTEEMIPSILKHIRDNWKTPGDLQLFPTDMEQLANEAKK